MPIRKESIGAQIRRVRMGRKLDANTGFLYHQKRELLVNRKKVTVIGLFVSDEQTFLVRPHLFEKRNGMNAVAWDAWLSGHYGEILRDSILPRMGLRTDKQWRLYRIIGVLPNDSTGVVRSKTHKKRNKTKRKRR